MFSSNGYFANVFNKELYQQMQKGGAAIAGTSTSIPIGLQPSISPQKLDSKEQFPLSPPQGMI